MRYEETLFGVAEPTLRLSFTIAYNSRNTATGMLGPGFTHTFSKTIKPLGGSSNWIQLVDGNGERTIYYSPSPGSKDFTAVWPADAVGTVSLNSTTHLYTLPDLEGTATAFDSITGGPNSTTDRWWLITSGS